MLCGYGALAVVYLLLFGPLGGWPLLVLVVLLYGVFYAATDGVLMALAGESLPDALRSTGMALVATSTSLARLASSLLFGLLWTLCGVQNALVVFAGGLSVAVLAATVLVGRRRPEVRDADVAG